MNKREYDQSADENKKANPSEGEKELPSVRKMYAELAKVFHEDVNKEDGDIIREITSANEDATKGVELPGAPKGSEGEIIRGEANQDRLEYLYRKHILKEDVKDPLDSYKEVTKLRVSDLEKMNIESRVKAANLMVQKGCYGEISNNLNYFASVLNKPSIGQFVYDMAMLAVPNGQLNLLLHNEILAANIPDNFLGYLIQTKSTSAIEFMKIKKTSWDNGRTYKALEDLCRQGGAFLVAENLREFQNLPAGVARALWEGGFQRQAVFGLGQFDDQAKHGIIQSAFAAGVPEQITYIFLNLDHTNITLTDKDAANLIKNGYDVQLFQALSKFPGYTQDQFYADVWKLSPDQQKKKQAENILAKKGMLVGEKEANPEEKGFGKDDYFSRLPLEKLRDLMHGDSKQIAEIIRISCSRENLSSISLDQIDPSLAGCTVEIAASPKLPEFNEEYGWSQNTLRAKSERNRSRDIQDLEFEKYYQAIKKYDAYRYDKSIMVECVAIAGFPGTKNVDAKWFQKVLSEYKDLIFRDESAVMDYLKQRKEVFDKKE